MNINRNISGSPIIWGAGVLFGLVLALMMGVAVGRQDFQRILLVGGCGFLIAISAILRANIWIIIPLCSALTGSILVLPLPFAVNELAILLAFGMFVILYAMKSVPDYPRFNIYDTLMIVNLIYLLTVYIRNPAGLLRFQTDIIGGRPYVSVLFALLAYWVLQHITLSHRERYLIPVLTFIGGMIGSLLLIITAFITPLGRMISPLYNDKSFSVGQGDLPVDSQGTNRLIYLSKYGRSLGPFLMAFRNPIHLAIFINPLFSLFFYSALLAVLLSGFRSFFVHFLGLAAIATYYRSGLSGLFRIGLFGVIALIAFISIQESNFELPLSIQRTLSFLPGSWDPTAVEEARYSGEWRFEMWRQALQSEHYIHNKILGDGFGFRISDLAGFLDMGGMEHAGNEMIQEYFLIVGAYHSGPVSTIRTVGYVGLVLFNIWIFAMAIYAWKLIKTSKGTPFFVWALFVGSPAVIMPAYYWLIFGGLEDDFPAAILCTAALNMLSRSLSKWYLDQDKTASSTSSHTSA